MKNTPVIYRIYCLPTGKSYIGKSTNVKSRFRCHRFALRRGTHYSTEMQSDWDKYGEDTFQFKVLEVCTSANVDEREEYWTLSLENTYNKKVGYKFDDETKRKIGEKSKGRKACLGRKHSEETKKKLREAAKGRTVPKTKESEERRRQSIKDSWARRKAAKKEVSP